MVQGVMEKPPEHVYHAEDSFEPQIRPQRPFQGNIRMLNRASFFHSVREGKLMVFKASLYDVNMVIEEIGFKRTPVGADCPRTES